MLSFSQSRRMLNIGGNDFTDDQIKQIMDFAYLMAKIQIESEINLLKSNSNDECNSLLQSIN